VNTRRFCFCCLAGLLFVTCLGGVPWAGGGQKSQSTVGSYYEQTLREKQIEPTATGLMQYFRSLHPDEAQRKRAAQLIRDMGSTESFAKREAAMAQLLVLPRPPSPSIPASLKSRATRRLSGPRTAATAGLPGGEKNRTNVKDAVSRDWEPPVTL
jgi:hypothetical protein